MKMIRVDNPNKKINGILATVEGTGVSFTRYYVNKHKTYLSENLHEKIFFDNPVLDFKNIDKSEREKDRLLRKALKELAEKLFPGLKVLYFET